MNANFKNTGSLTRRRFLCQTTAAAVSLSALSQSRILAANRQLRLGLIGCGDRGRYLLKAFERGGKAGFVAVSDPDLERMNQAIGERTGSLQPFRDYRELLDQQDIDAVVIASPNHWHALHTIHACQAGKDVYVEKPVTFSVDQGSAVLAAARKYQRIVQAGTQNRSDTGLIPAFEMIRQGELGAIQSIRGLCYRNRASIGKLDSPKQPPTSVDYDLWLGGAQDLPLFRPRFHYDWHWDFNTGNGDVGNQAPHEFDLINWVLGDPTGTSPVCCIGNRFAWDDAGNTPNMQTVWCQIGGVPVIFEVNNLWINPEENKSPSYRGIGVGVIVSCEQGDFIGGRGGGKIVAKDGETVLHQFKGDSGESHYQNFIEAVLNRSGETLRAPIEKSVNSALWPHLANLSYRSGVQVSRGEMLEQVPAEVAEVVHRQELQLAKWGIDTQATPYVLGNQVSLNETGELQGNERARELARPNYRRKFQIPAEV